MNVLGLVGAQRKEPFYNLGGDPVSTFQDLAVDGQPLLLKLEKVSGEHLDVVTPLTSEFPSGAVEFLDDLLGTNTRWRTSMGWATQLDEIPIYLCPVDYDLLCGGIVATLERSEDQIRLHQFRHTSTDEQYNERVTEALRTLDFRFARGATNMLLDGARAIFALQAEQWVRPEARGSTTRRWVSRFQRRRRQ